jgi:hypothetical protein
MAKTENPQKPKFNWDLALENSLLKGQIARLERELGFIKHSKPYIEESEIVKSEAGEKGEG